MAWWHWSLSISKCGHRGQWSESSLLQVMTHHLLTAKPLPESGIVKRTIIGDEFQWNINQNKNIFCQQNILWIDDPNFVKINFAPTLILMIRSCNWLSIYIYEWDIFFQDLDYKLTTAKFVCETALQSHEYTSKHQWLSRIDVYWIMKQIGPLRLTIKGIVQSFHTLLTILSESQDNKYL